MTPSEEDGFVPSFLQKVIEEIQKTAEILGWKRPFYSTASCIHCGHNTGYHGLVFLGGLPNKLEDTIDFCNAKSWLRRKNCRCSKLAFLPCNCGHEYDDHAHLFKETVCYHSSPCGPEFPCTIEGCKCTEFVTKGESLKIPDKHVWIRGAFSCIHCGHNKRNHLLLPENPNRLLHQTHVCSVKTGRNLRCKCTRFETSETRKMGD